MASGVIKKYAYIAEKYYANTSTGIIQTDIPYNRFISAIPRNWTGVFCIADKGNNNCARILVKNIDNFAYSTDERIEISAKYY